jgi:hypothetical protein
VDIRFIFRTNDRCGIAALNYPSFCLSKLDVLMRQLLHTRLVSRIGVETGSETSNSVSLELRDVVSDWD